jgi:hypothetical protein
VQERAERLEEGEAVARLVEQSLRLAEVACGQSRSQSTRDAATTERLRRQHEAHDRAQFRTSDRDARARRTHRRRHRRATRTSIMSNTGRPLDSTMSRGKLCMGDRRTLALSHRTSSSRLLSEMPGFALVGAVGVSAAPAPDPAPAPAPDPAPALEAAVPMLPTLTSTSASPEARTPLPRPLASARFSSDGAAPTPSTENMTHHATSLRTAQNTSLRRAKSAA